MDGDGFAERSGWTGGLVRGARMEQTDLSTAAFAWGQISQFPSLRFGGYWRGFERMVTVLRNEVIGGLGARMEQTDLSRAAFAWGQMSQFPSLRSVII